MLKWTSEVSKSGMGESVKLPNGVGSTGDMNAAANVAIHTELQCISVARQQSHFHTFIGEASSKSALYVMFGLVPHLAVAITRSDDMPCSKVTIKWRDYCCLRCFKSCMWVILAARAAAGEPLQADLCCSES